MRIKIASSIWITIERVLQRYQSVSRRLFFLKPVTRAGSVHENFLLLGGGGLENARNDFRGVFPDKVKEKIAQADRIRGHIFDLLGSRPKRLGEESECYQSIDWHSDFKSGYRWDPKTFHRDVKFGHRKGVDIKIPWELSRFQHLNILGQAYLLTGDIKYAKEFEDQICDWIDSNRVGFGVNWACAMDIALRAMNWLVAGEHFSSGGALSEDFLNRYYASIREHGRFIRSHLENRRGTASNHYIANLAGLFFISVYCPFFSESARWREFAGTELAKEIKRQVYADGCGFEASTSYHRLALELFFYTELIAKRSGAELPAGYREIVRKMFEFSLYAVKPNGMAPQVGDNDSGRALIFAGRPVLEHKYLLSLAAIYYNDPAFKVPGFGFDEEAFWVFGAKGRQAYENMPCRESPITSRSFRDAGWHIMRHRDSYCFISCGPNGRGGEGGHAHNDKLGIDLHMDGRDIIVDTGTYAYTSDPFRRNEFRSTEAHNTVKVDGHEQSALPLYEMFRLPEGFSVKAASLEENGSEVIFSGKIRYSGVEHSRSVVLCKKSGNWSISDRIASPGAFAARALFHLRPGIDEAGGVLSENGRKIAAVDTGASELKTAGYDYSPEYGLKERAKCLIVPLTTEGSAPDKSATVRILRH